MPQADLDTRAPARVERGIAQREPRRVDVVPQRDGIHAGELVVQGGFLLVGVGGKRGGDQVFFHGRSLVWIVDRPDSPFEEHGGDANQPVRRGRNPSHITVATTSSAPAAANG